MTTARFDCYGVPIELGADDARTLERMAARLPPGARASASAAEAKRFRLRGRVTAPMLQTFESKLALHVASHAEELLFVHAGVVGWRGRALVFPGRSHAGKSTLVAALVRAGASYYSDEYALIDGEGRVRPYARPLSLRRAAGAVRVAPERLGRVGRAPLPVGMVVLCRFGQRTRLEALSPGRAVLAILKQTVAARAQAATAMERLARVAMSAPVVAGTRGEARQFARALLDGTLEFT